MEDVDSAFSDHGQSEDAHEDSHDHSEVESPWSEIFGPVINDSGDEGFDTTELRVNAEDQQHGEEQKSPEG